VKQIKHGRLGILIGLLCPALYASEIDLKLTTSDGSTQVSVDNAAAASVAAIDSTGNVTFSASLKPNGQPGTAGEVLQSNGPGASPTWIPPLLISTNTWTAQQTYSQSVMVSSNLVVNNGGVISGNGSGLTNLLPGAITAGVYGGITGLGAQSQNLNLNSNLINNLGTPAVGTDAANKTYVDVTTAAANASMITYVNTATGAANASMITYVNTATGAVNASMITYVNTATGAVNASLITYVNTATSTVNASVWSSTGTWTAQQTYTKQISISTSVVLSGSLIASGSAGSSGQLLQSQGSGSAPAWISSTTFLGGAPILKQGSASLSFAVKNATYTMTTSDFGILANANGVGITITLPPASNAGMLAFIVKTDSSGSNVAIAGAGTDTIEGITPVNLTAQYQKRLLIADGESTWYVMSQ